MRALPPLLLALLVLVSWNRDATAEKRVALVIGNSAYAHAPNLATALNDAAALSDAFKGLGFSVIDGRDLKAPEMRRVLRAFESNMADADVAVVYFAGYGVAIGGNNYLVATDARLKRDSDIRDETIDLAGVVAAIQPAKRLRIVILDACRDNPFRTVKQAGLAAIQPPDDTLVAFAAKAGSVARDGDGRQSPYASALASRFAEPGIDVRIAFGGVRDDVLKTTGNKQQPWVYGALSSASATLTEPFAPDRPPVRNLAVPEYQRIQNQPNAIVDDIAAKPPDPTSRYLSAHPPQSSAADAKEAASTQQAAQAELARRQAEVEALARAAANRVQAEAERRRAAMEEMRQQTIQPQPVQPPQMSETAPPSPAAKPESQLPLFPWPPPRASASYVLPKELLPTRRTIGDVRDAILTALEGAGYVEKAFFRTGDDGVALVTRLESIDDNGASIPEPHRWAATPWASDRGLRDFLAGLFFVELGHYRVIVFVMQDAPFHQSQDKVSEGDAKRWLADGANQLPKQYADQPLEQSTCTALIYEFASDGQGVKLVDSRLTGRDHLEKSGILALLRKPG